MPDHGTRATYRSGCRCLPCKAASAADRKSYRAKLAEADVRALVSAEEVQAYLRGLQAVGIGYRQAAKQAGLSSSEVAAIVRGERRRVRRETAARVQTVRPVLALGANVKAWPTWRLVRLLLKEGFTKAELARRLGLRTFRLSRHDERITVERALLVHHLYRIVTADGPEDSPANGQEGQVSA